MVNPAKLNEKALLEMGNVMKVQKLQTDSIERMEENMESALDDTDKNLAASAAHLKKISEDDEKIESLLTKGIQLSNTQINEIEKGNEITQKESRASQDYKPVLEVDDINLGLCWDDYVSSITAFANTHSLSLVSDPFQELLSEEEYQKLDDEINKEFSKKTSIVNKVDLSFLAIATALTVGKALLFPLVSEKVGYGEKIDKGKRKRHNDKSIEKEQRETLEKYRDKQLEKHEPGDWINMIFRKPPYDITAGSKETDIGNVAKNAIKKAEEPLGLCGTDHRLKTLGHDPVLGWVFGTANIMDECITNTAFQTNRISRNPTYITTERVPMPLMFKECYDLIKEEPLYLPAAVVAQGAHLKSDEFTKCGLPVPVIETFSPEFAGKLYKNQYDALCLSRDLKVIGTSAAISMLIDMIITLSHALFYSPEKDGPRELYEVRTRKILLIANAIGTSSNIVYTVAAENPKALDIGGLIVTVMHLFLDAKFMLSVKKEFVENKIYEKIADEIAELNELEMTLSENARKLDGIIFP